jgi:prepilin-type processing-associated H-X9-DG protein
VANKYLPPGRFGCDGAADQNCSPFEFSRGASGFLRMLPYLEEQSLFDRIDWTFGPWKARDPDDSCERDPGPNEHRNNQFVISTILAVMNCPTDLKLPYAEWNSKQEATGSYAFCAGTKGPSCATRNTAKYRKPPTGQGLDGVFTYLQGNERHGIQLRAITDGVSKTYFFGETIDGHLKETRNRWTAAGRYVDSFRTTENPINTRVGLGAFEYGADGYQTTGCFASRHPGGAQFAYGDGRVEFVSEDIALEIYQAVSTRAAGDDVGGTGSTSAAPKPSCT